MIGCGALRSCAEWVPAVPQLAVLFCIGHMPFARLASQKDEWMADKLRIPKLKQSNHSESSDGSPDAMYRMTPSDRGRRISGMFADLFRTANSSLSPADPDGLRYLAVVSVIGHWFIAAVVLFEIDIAPTTGFRGTPPTSCSY